MRLKMRKRESTVEHSCGCDGTVFDETRMQANLEPMTHSHPSLYVRAAHALVSCTAPLRWTRKRTYLQHHKTILGVRSYSVFTTPPGGHICLQCAYVFTLPVGYNGSLSTVNETCNKDKGHCTKKMSVHIFQVLPHIKIGWTPVLRTWELFWMSCLSLSMQVIKFASATGFPVLGPPFWVDTLWSILL